MQGKTFILPTVLFLVLVIFFQNCGKGDFKTTDQLSSLNNQQSSTNDPSDNDPNNNQPDPQDPLPQQPPLPQEPTLPTVEKKYFLYVAVTGTSVIETYSINAADVKLKKLSSLGVAAGTAPLVIHPNKKYLYAGNSSSKSVAAYMINQNTGQLSYDRQTVLGISPTYLHIDSLSKNMLVPSYSSSAIAVLPINGNGTIAANYSDLKPTGRNAHSAMSSQNSKFVFVADTGANTISQFLFNPNTGVLTPNPAEAEVKSPVGSDPRHVVHHPNLNLIYYVNETGDSVSAYSVDTNTGRLKVVQTISTLPKGIDANSNTCADLHMTPDRKFLYASNRGHNSLAIFSIAADGRLTAIGHQLVPGIPREFEIDPTGKFIYVAGLTANKLSSYKIGTNGLLTPIESLSVNGAPQWVYSLELP